MLNRPRIYVYRLIAIYFIFSIIWIKFSDVILFKYLKISNDATSFQTYKEVFFIFFSTALLYFVQLSEIIKSESKDKIEPVESFDGAYNFKLKKNNNSTISVNHEIFKNMRHGLILIDRNCKIAEISETANKILGYGKNGTDLIGLGMSSLFSTNQFKEISENFMNGNNHYEKEIFLKKRDKCFLPAWISISMVKGHSDEFDHYVLVVEDLTEFKAKEQKIRNLKKLDPLTGLKNQDAMNKYLKKLPTNKFNFAVLYIDINNLKLINDSLGRNTGDEVLKKSGERLLEIEDKYIKLYRMRGDEFILLVMGQENLENLDQVTKKILNLFKNPMKLNGENVHITVKMGVSIYPYDGENVDAVIQNAHTALRYLKNGGKNEVKFFKTNLKAVLKNNLELASSLRNSIIRNELILHYQPQVSTFNQEIIGLEALVRWEHPKHGLISPMKFIPIAESSGFINEIGMWVLETAAEQFKKWIDSGYKLKKLSVNLSPLQFKSDALVEDILKVLHKTGLSPEYLDIEITESVLIENMVDTENKLLNLKLNGISISIDDFGSGYSSLGYLKSFSFDKIKVDRNFIKDIPKRDDGSIAKIINNLGTTLGLEVIAEGVETKSQYDFMKDIGVEVIQGYYFAKPLPTEGVEEFMNKVNLC